MPSSRKECRLTYPHKYWLHAMYRAICAISASDLGRFARKPSLLYSSPPSAIFTIGLEVTSEVKKKMLLVLDTHLSSGRGRLWARSN